MLIAHFSDLHYSPSHLVEADRCFSFAVTAAIERGASLAVVSGDATDHRLDAHSPALNALATQIHRLANAMPVIMLQGTFSHEPPGTLDNFTYMFGEYPILVANRVMQAALVGKEFIVSKGPTFDAAEITTLLMRNPSVIATCLPTLHKGRVALAVGAQEAATASADILGDYLRDAGLVNDRLRSTGFATIGISHGTVVGCQTEHGVSMAGFDHEFSTNALFDARCSAFMLGHIHLSQSWTQQGQTVAYAGSIGAFHYGEIGQKGFLLWNVDEDAASYELVPTPARKTITVDCNGLPDMDLLVELAAASADKFVRVRWQIDEEHRQAVDRKEIERLFKDAAELKLEGRILPVTRSRAEGISVAFGLDAKLQRWAEVADVNAKPLVERLDLMFAADAESIAQQVIADLRADGVMSGSVVEEAGLIGNDEDEIFSSLF